MTQCFPPICSLATPRDPRSLARCEITAEAEEPVHDKVKLPWQEKSGQWPEIGISTCSTSGGVPMHTQPPVPDAGPPASPGTTGDAGRDASARFEGKRFRRDSAYVLDFVRKQQNLNEVLADDRNQIHLVRP